MPNQALQTVETDLCTIVAHWVNQRTFGRVRSLRVENTSDGIVLHGCAGSYYVKQLAVQAALEATHSLDGAVERSSDRSAFQVITDIQVIKS